MDNLQHILFYSRPDINQDAALRQVRQLCLAFRARLTLMTVIDDLPSGWTLTRLNIDAGQLAREARTRAQNSLLGLAADLQEAGITCTPCVEIGKPFIEVIRRVKADAVDLVVLASGPDQTLQQRLFGGLALHLIRKCPCPVWVVRAGGHEPPQALVAAVDLNQDELSTPDMARRSMNTDVLQAARTIGQHLAMELHVVQAFEVRFEGYLEVRAGLDPEVTEGMNKALMRDLNRQLNDLCRHELSAPAAPATGGMPYHPHLERGRPAAVIAPLIKRKKIDLLVMGTMGRSGIAGMLLGNTAEALLSEVECSVLVLKPPGFVSPVL